MNNPTYIVTGATGAIGKKLTTRLWDKGGTVIMACRNTSKGEAIAREIDRTNSGRLIVKRLDLASFTSVREFSSWFLDSGMRLKGLFNNAGIMPGHAVLTEDGYEEATQVNFLSTGLLTRLLLPAMDTGSGIIFTTSVTRRIVRLHMDWRIRSEKHFSRFITYGRSKLMLTHFALDLGKELVTRGITVNCSDPGVVDSAMLRLGISPIDSLCDRLVRPIVYSEAQGAAPALAAMESGESGRIYTLKKSIAIPESYSASTLHHLASDAIKSICNYIPNK